ncbi:nuclear transport factor 2 family protein [Metallibacterium sp.]|uniref:nuclear transport factor 2 family protein n=1 Tax=Metallibacterium sp. TaxID=2940281 RepID=UPI002625B93D|nr:nuclear transport factor 2 family protein [Metallibacterium sp.]
MNAHAAIEATLHAAEAALLDAQQRGDVDAIAALLASDFEEIGSSGRRYDRDSMLAALGTAILDAAEITDFSLRLLAADLALVSFRTRVRRGGIVLHSLRSSLWRREYDAWRIAFHQGTPCAG